MLAVLVHLIGFVAAAQAETQVQQVVFNCARGVDLPVSFINPDGDTEFAVMQIEGKLVTLRSAPNASGALYIALNEQDSYRLFTKGNEAFVMHLAADHTAHEVAILSDCHLTE